MPLTLFLVNEGGQMVVGVSLDTYQAVCTVHTIAVYTTDEAKMALIIIREPTCECLAKVWLKAFNTVCAK